MHQNLDVIVWQFNYGKNSFAVLIPDIALKNVHRIGESIEMEKWQFN